ncbi:hypothetical protein G7K_6831-t1 [Saitoella complicata NRRL Y-17804]|uniref:Uncharacterized protein n=1 Tax=Saitoella complicata (strain BCRC 22490 / CBS 7301 / JCM 7358 / NBRC 10748 / NRRL Y-17804) TaxID=698492 RepID=A0A0E9NSK6_SAICN|nr:hypothetical protein G7K_6831-t1 [Saitoella complicata NRRL Y-17804]
MSDITPSLRCGGAPVVSCFATAPRSTCRSFRILLGAADPVHPALLCSALLHPPPYSHPSSILRVYPSSTSISFTTHQRVHAPPQVESPHRSYRIPLSCNAFCKIVSLTAANTNRIFPVSVACVRCGYTFNPARFSFVNLYRMNLAAFDGSGPPITQNTARLANHAHSKEAPLQRIGDR